MKGGKENLRKIYKEKRESLQESDLDKLNQKIHDLMFSRMMIHRYDRIHIYLTIPEKTEPDTSRIIATLQSDFAPDLYVPKMKSRGVLEHRVYTNNSTVIPNKWGVPEPCKSDGISSEKFFETDQDILVIVPLLIFDKMGYRVGYGGGYYDRFLANRTANTTLVGLSFFEPIEKIENLDAFDIPLHFCVTPERVWSF